MYHVIRHSIWKISKKTHKKHCNALCMVCNVCLVNALSLAPFFCVVGRSISHNEVKSFLKEHYHFHNSKAEVFYYVNYVNVNYSVKNSTIDCKYYFISYEFPDVFLNNLLYWHFLYCFGFNLREKSCEKVNIYNQQLIILPNNWRLYNWRCRKPLLISS